MSDLKAPEAGALVSSNPVHNGTTYADWPIRGWEADDLQCLTDLIHGSNVVAGWWNDLKTGLPMKRNVPEMLALIHSEISEGLEGHRKGLMDDKLPEYPMLAVELADALIRILDLAGALGAPIGEIVVAKLRFNRTRPDHKRDARLALGGKAL